MKFFDKIFEVKYEPKEGYEEFKKELYKRGLKNKLVTIDEHDRENICKNIQILNINKNDEYLEFIKFEPSKRITISTDYRIGLYIKDDNGEEIPINTKINVLKYHTFVPPPIELYRMFYHDIMLNNENFGFNFDKNVQIDQNEQFSIGIDNKELSISKENIEFKIIADYWEEKTK